MTPISHATAAWILRMMPAVFLAGAYAAAPAAARAETPARWQHVHFSIYFTFGEIERLLVDTASMRETMDYFAPVKAEKVYLEVSSGESVDVPLMRDLVARLRAMGFRVSGALVPTVPDGLICYNNPDHMARLERRARSAAEVFDEIILDDWLFTICTCEKCVAGRGAMSWADYRSRLLLEGSKKHIIDPARGANPRVKVIIKYPNWYEGHRDNGYDVLNETRQFDAMAAGIETRARATHDQHIPIYSGYVFQKWWGGVDPHKWIGSWLDNYTMKGNDNDYVAQVWQAVMAQAPEIILWSGGNLHHTGQYSDVYPHFREMLPEFDRVAGMLEGEARGVPIYLPYGSTGEYNIFGYLGMAGIPLAPAGEFPADGRVAIFTKHSLRDPGLAGKMLQRLRSGRDVFMTWELFRQLGNTEFRNALTLVDEGGTVTSSQFRTRRGWWSDQLVSADRPFTFPRIATTTWPYVREVALVREDYDFGVFLNARYLNGNLYVLNMPDNSYDLLRLPAAVLDVIRRSCTGDLGVQLSGPGGVAMYPFGEREYVLYNMSDATAPLALRFAGERPASGWRELVHDRQLAVTKEEHTHGPGGPLSTTTVSLTLRPFELAIVKAP